jgi:hypothetical protein
MRPMLYIFGVVAIAVLPDSILFGGSYVRMLSDGELSLFKSVLGFFY